MQELKIGYRVWKRGGTAKDVVKVTEIPKASGQKYEVVKASGQKVIVEPDEFWKIYEPISYK